SGAVDAEESAFFGERFVAGADRATVAEAAQVLGRVERETSGESVGARRFAVALGADRLGRVLDHGNLSRTGDVVDRFHVRQLPEEVYGHDRFGRLRQLRLDLLGGDV